MTIKKPSTIVAFIILPLILISLGGALSSLTRVYVGSGTFVFSIFLGGLVTSVYYTQFIRSKIYIIGLILVFGVIVPILYINAAHEVFGSGIKEYNETWSPIYLATTLIGLIEIILYLGIITSSFFMLLSRTTGKIILFFSVLIKKSISLTDKTKDN